MDSMTVLRMFEVNEVKVTNSDICALILKSM